MANPNIINVATITGKTSVAVLTTSTTNLITNSAASGKIFKVNSLVVSNISTTTSHSVTVDLYRSSVAYRLASTLVVPANSTLIVIGKDSSIYLEESDTLRILANAASVVHAVTSYEEIS